MECSNSSIDVFIIESSAIPKIIEDDISSGRLELPKSILKDYDDEDSDKQVDNSQC